MDRRLVRIVIILLALLSALILVGYGQDMAPKGIIIKPPDPTGLSVRVWVDKGAYTLGENIQIHFEVNDDACVYIYDIDPTGKIFRLFPHGYREDQAFVRAGEYVLPDSSEYTLAVGGPTGTEYIQAIATKQAIMVGPPSTPGNPFPLLGENPAVFKNQIQNKLLSIIPEPSWAESWTQFEVVSGYTPPFGTLTVNSSPQGAVLKIDGAFVGYTPRTLYLRQGYHVIELSKEGYRTGRKGVFVIAGRVRTVNASLIRVGPPANEPPEATFSFSPSNPLPGSWIHFDASGSYDPDGSITSYSWDFGDGNNAYGDSAYHRFTSSGSHDVTLRVTDDDGAIDVVVRTVQVNLANQSPQAEFSCSPCFAEVSEWIRFDATDSYDSDGRVVSYRWSFDDLGATRYGSVVYYQFNAPGTYNVRLKVTDDDGATDTVVRRIEVGINYQPPIASFSYAPSSPSIGQQIVLDARASYDPDGNVVAYRWDLDGNGIDDAAGPISSVRYYNQGAHVVRLTVIDNSELSGTSSQAIITGSLTVIPGGPMMGNTPGIFVWGTGSWHVSLNSTSSWSSTHDYQLEILTDGAFQQASRSVYSGVGLESTTPISASGKQKLLLSGEFYTGAIDYNIKVAGADNIYFRLRMDIDGDGILEESKDLVHLRQSRVSPPVSPFVVGLDKTSSGALLPGTNFRIGHPWAYTSSARFISWVANIAELEGY